MTAVLPMVNIGAFQTTSGSRTITLVNIPGSSTATYYTSATTSPHWPPPPQHTFLTGRISVQAGRAVSIDLPDGAVLDVDAQGNYTLCDANAKVAYRGNRVREFNRYINASDLLEEFIDYVSSIGGIGKREFLALPVELFIRWVVLRAAETDRDPADDARRDLLAGISRELKPPRPNCRKCGRFIPDAMIGHGLRFCSKVHAINYAARLP